MFLAMSALALIMNNWMFTKVNLIICYRIWSNDTTDTILPLNFNHFGLMFLLRLMYLFHQLFLTLLTLNLF